MKPIYKSSFIIFSTVVIGIIAYALWIRPLQKNYEAHHVNIHGIYLLNPIKISHLKLIDQNNKPFTEDNLRNHWSFLFFGFTHCNMVCPVTLTALNQFYQRIEKKVSEKNKPQVVFITIDPDKDTTARLKQYVSQFNRDFMGARTENIALIKKQFHILSERVDKTSDQYNHSTELLLINPNAEIQAYFSFPHKPDQLEKDYLAILSQFQNR